MYCRKPDFRRLDLVRRSCRLCIPVAVASAWYETCCGCHSCHAVSIRLPGRSSFRFTQQCPCQFSPLWRQGSRRRVPHPQLTEGRGNRRECNHAQVHRSAVLFTALHAVKCTRRNNRVLVVRTARPLHTPRERNCRADCGITAQLKAGRTSEQPIHASSCFTNEAVARAAFTHGDTRPTARPTTTPTPTSSLCSMTTQFIDSSPPSL